MGSFILTLEGQRPFQGSLCISILADSDFCIENSMIMASSETKTLFYQVRSEVKQPKRGAFHRRHHVETEVPLSEHFRHDGRSSVYMDNFYASTYKREIATVAGNSNGNNQSAR